MERKKQNTRILFSYFSIAVFSPQEIVDMNNLVRANWAKES